MFSPMLVLSEDFTSFGNAWPPDAAGNIYPSLLIQGSDKKQLNEAYQYCSDKKISNFSLSLSLSEPLEAASTLDLISFFFIPSYYHINGQRICNLISHSVELMQQVKHQILDCSYSQGIENLVIHCLATAPAGTGSAVLHQEQHFFTSTKDLLIAYKKKLLSEDDYNPIFFLYEPRTDLDILSAGILEANETIKKENPVAWKLKTEIAIRAAEINLLKKQYLSVINELNNYKLHLELMRSNHQAKELQDYYDKEYEILPRWYKRFGHILKVFMGKRSLQSLFSDNAKKHSN